MAPFAQVFRRRSKWTTNPSLADNQALIRLSDIDDWGDLFLNNVRIASIQNPVMMDTGWIDLTPLLKKGTNKIHFELSNSVYGGSGFNLQLEVGKRRYESGHAYNNACPCGDAKQPRKPVLQMDFEVTSDEAGLTVRCPDVAPMTG